MTCFLTAPLLFPKHFYLIRNTLITKNKQKYNKRQEIIINNKRNYNKAQEQSYYVLRTFLVLFGIPVQTCKHIISLPFWCIKIYMWIDAGGWIFKSVYKRARATSKMWLVCSFAWRPACRSQHCPCIFICSNSLLYNRLQVG